MAGGESIYEDGGVGAQGSCEVGEKCLESEALAEMMEGNGLAMLQILNIFLQLRNCLGHLLRHLHKCFHRLPCLNLL
jgi:hypothetical protein